MRPLMTQCEDEHTELSACCTGSVSIGFIHATPGEMKSLRSSAERMALIVSGVWRGFIERAGVLRSGQVECGRTRRQNTEVCKDVEVNSERKKSPGKYSSLTTPRCAEQDPEIFHSQECATYR